MRLLLTGLSLVLVLTGCGTATAGRSFVTPTPAAERIFEVGKAGGKGDWVVQVHEVGAYERYVQRSPSPPPQGRLIVAEFAAKNVSPTAKSFTTTDLRLLAPDGREFSPAGQTGSIERGFVVAQTVQPGLTTQNRVVFDVDPAVTEYTLRILNLHFRIALDEIE